MNLESATAKVAVVMGSSSDWETMSAAADVLRHLGVAFSAQVVSAHRMPDEMFAYAASARSRGLAAIIAGAGHRTASEAVDDGVVPSSNGSCAAWSNRERCDGKKTVARTRRNAKTKSRSATTA